MTWATDTLIDLMEALLEHVRQHLAEVEET